MIILIMLSMLIMVIVLIVDADADGVNLPKINYQSINLRIVSHFQEIRGSHGKNNELVVAVVRTS